jgi:hypothetical protein
MAHTPTHKTSASQNLNFQQDLISGFGNLPLAYVQGAVPLSTLAAYVRDASYEPIIMPNFEAQEAQIVGNIETALADKPDLLEEALYLLAEVSAGTLSPEAAQQRFAIAEGSAALGQQSPTAQLVSVLLSDAQNLADSVRQFTTDNDIVQLDGQAYKRRSADERNKLLRDYGLDNVLSDPELYGFEKQARELANLDRNVSNLNERRDRAALQGDNAAKRLAEAESVMAAYLQEKADRAPSRAATGARRSVQNAGVADRAGIKAGRAVDTTVYDEKFQENLLAEAMNRNAAVAPYAQGAELVPSPGVMGAGGSVPLSTSDRPVAAPEVPVRSGTVYKAPTYTDADLRRLRDEARSLEAEQKIAGVQAGMQKGLRDYLASKPDRYMAPAERLLTQGLAQMGAAVTPARSSKPKIKLDSGTISRIVNGI